MDVIAKIVTVSATIVGAIWSYYAFFRERLSQPRLNVTHEITSLAIENGQHLLKVYATFTNIGRVRVELLIWRLRADQILPLTKASMKDLTKGSFTDAHDHAHWNCLAEGIFSKNDKSFKVALEPGESDSAAANLVIPSGIDVAQIYSHFSITDDLTRPEGWPRRTLVDFRPKETVKGDPDE